MIACEYDSKLIKIYLFKKKSNDPIAAAGARGRAAEGGKYGWRKEGWERGMEGSVKYPITITRQGP